MTISVNPIQTTVAAGTFSISLDGFIQGMAQDDPAVRYQLTGGIFMPPTTDTVPMFGGVPIAEYLPPTGSTVDPSLGSYIQHITANANALGGATGICVFNQAHNMVNSPQSPVQQASAGMTCHFYRFGSNARIPLALNPAFPGLPGAPVTPAPAVFNWDSVNNWITNAAASATIFTLPTTIKVIGFNIGNSLTVSYNPVTGFATWNRPTNSGTGAPLNGGSCILIQI